MNLAYITDLSSLVHTWPEEPYLSRPVLSPKPLFTPDDAHRYATDPRVRPQNVTMVRNGRITGEPPSARSQSSTLVLDGLHQVHKPLRDLAKWLERTMDHPVTINAYRTPPGGKGFGKHWDTEPNMLVQTEGAKTWYLAPPVVPDPSTEKHRFSAVGLSTDERKRAEAQCRVYDLQAGQSLFIPRGWIHWGKAEEQESLHFTVAWHVHTWGWLLRRTLEESQGHPALRGALPPGFTASKQQGVLATEAVDRLRQWLASPDQL